MDPQILQMIKQFMMRVTLQGQEVSAFNACMIALDEALNPPAPPATPAPEGKKEGE